MLPRNCAAAHSSAPACTRNVGVVTTKYFTHFVSGSEEARIAREWSGVLELTQPIEGRKSASRELRQMIADSFDLESDEIRILHWARLH